MPRYYRRRYTRVVKPKKKWASNFVNLEAADTYGISAHYWKELPLVVNSVQTIGGVPTSPTPVIVKTGNFKVQMDFTYTVSAAAAVEVRAFVIYIPEGTSPTSNISRKYSRETS